MHMLFISPVVGLSGFISSSSRALSVPAPFEVVAPNPEFSNRYNISIDIPVQQPYRSRGPVPCSSNYCSFGCGCLRSTDILNCPNRQQWALTFDDGPSAFTEGLLDTLARRNLKVTFFVTGSQVFLFPQVLERAHREGHQIGIHTWSHRSLVSLSTDVVIAELEWTALIIEQVIGHRPKYFRPPFGDIDDRIRLIADRMGLVPVIWNFDSRDFAGSDDIVQRVHQSSQNWRNANNGIISLQHDLYARQVVFAEPVIDALLRRGMNIGTVADCHNDTNPYLEGPPPVPSRGVTSAPTVSVSLAPMSPPTDVPPTSVPTTQVKNSALRLSNLPFLSFIFAIYCH